jgi:hypothetical protein
MILDNWDSAVEIVSFGLSTSAIQTSFPLLS